MKYLLFLLFVILLSLKGYGQTYIGGHITGKVVLTAANGPVLDTSDIVVDPGASLTIMPGVVFKFDQYYTHNGAGVITVRGTFRALGTKDSMITFTTNAFVPSAGPWQGIYFTYPCSNYDSKEDTGCEIKYSILKYNTGLHLIEFGFSGCSICDSSASILIDHDSLGGFSGIGINNSQFVNPGLNQKVIVTNNIAARNIPSLFFIDGDSSIISGNLFDFSNIGIGPSVSITANAKCAVENNIFLTPIISVVGVWFHNNYVESTFLPVGSNDVLTSYNSLITNNTFTNTNTSELFFFTDSLSSCTHNNIRWDTMEGLPFGGINRIFTAGQVRISLSIPVIDASYNYIEGNLISDTLSIDSLIHDYSKDTNYIKINVHPLSLSPDTSAPMLPVTHALKNDAGNGNTEVSWSPSIEPDVAGYKIYYGHTNGYTFQYSVDVGKVTDYILNGVPISDTIAVTAYDHESNHPIAENNNQFTGHESWFAIALSTTATGIHAIPASSVLIYPNPFSNHFYIYSKSQSLSNGTLVIYNELGQMILRRVGLNGRLFLVNENNLPSGIYYYKILQEDKSVAKGILEKN